MGGIYTSPLTWFTLLFLVNHGSLFALNIDPMDILDYSKSGTKYVTAIKFFFSLMLHRLFHRTIVMWWLSLLNPSGGCTSQSLQCYSHSSYIKSRHSVKFNPFLRLHIALLTHTNLWVWKFSPCQCPDRYIRWHKWLEVNKGTLMTSAWLLSLLYRSVSNSTSYCTR